MTVADLELKGFDRFARVIDPRRVSRDLGKHVKAANQRLGLWMVEEIRRGIRERRYAPNAALTKVIKNSDVPLVDHGDLLGSASYELKDNWEFEVGVVKQGGDKQIGGRGSGGSATVGGSGANIAMILHEGCTISVTDRMRAFFRWLAHHTKGSVKPLSSKTTTIVIRPRPYLRDAVFSKQALMKVKDEWMRAIRETFEGVK